MNGGILWGQFGEVALDGDDELQCTCHMFWGKKLGKDNTGVIP